MWSADLTECKGQGPGSVSWNESVSLKANIDRYYARKVLGCPKVKCYITWTWSWSTRVVFIKILLLMHFARVYPCTGTQLFNHKCH